MNLMAKKVNLLILYSSRDHWSLKNLSYHLTKSRKSSPPQVKRDKILCLRQSCSPYISNKYKPIRKFKILMIIAKPPICHCSNLCQICFPLKTFRGKITRIKKVNLHNTSWQNLQANSIIQVPNNNLFNSIITLKMGYRSKPPLLPSRSRQWMAKAH